MRALRYYGKEDLRLEEIPEPECRKGWIKIKPAFAGICGTDLHEYTDGANLIPTTPHPITEESVPITLGHEFSGTVEEVGEDATKKGLKIGDRVAIQPTIYDGTCGACKLGMTNCCVSNGFIGLSGWGGGLAEHAVVPEDAVIPLHDDVSLEHGALVEPLSVAWHAVNQSPFKPNDAVLVLGGGPIGLAVLQVLKARGAGAVVLSEMAPRRKDLAKELGATHVLDPTKDDIVSFVHGITEGFGVPVGFDCAGVQAGLTTAMLAVQPRGTLVNVAVWPRPAYLDMNELVFRERNYMGVACYVKGDFEAVIDALATGKLKPQAMITRKIKIEEVEEKGFKALVEDKGNHVKILVDLQAGMA